MVSSYSIDPEQRLVRMQVRGEVTADGLMSFFNRVIADPLYDPAMRVLGDYREAHGHWDYSDIQRFRDYVVSLRMPEEGTRWAALVVPGAFAAAGHVLILISEAVGARVKMQMFDDQRRALAWLWEDRTLA